MLVFVPRVTHTHEIVKVVLIVVWVRLLSAIMHGKHCIFVCVDICMPYVCIHYFSRSVNFTDAVFCNI